MTNPAVHRQPGLHASRFTRTTMQMSSCRGGEWNRPRTRRADGGGTARQRQLPARRLRHVGYVSPDFRDHIVARPSSRFLMHHDRAQFEVFCYSSVGREDAVTRRSRGYGQTWRSDCQQERRPGGGADPRTDRIDDCCRLYAATWPITASLPACVSRPRYRFPWPTRRPRGWRPWITGWAILCAGPGGQ